MARSSYIYLLTQYGTPWAAFTVKHELITYVEQRIPAHLYSEYRVHRIPDGQDTVLVNPIHTQTLREFVA